MKNENNENLKEFLAKFLNAQDAARAAEDIAEGEHILDLNPAPEPEPALLDAIKHRMVIATGHGQRHSRYHFVWQLAAMAAAFAVIAWAGIAFFQEHSETSEYLQMQAQSFWQDSSDNSIDAQLAQIEQRETEEPVITFEVSSTGDTPAINDVSNELTEVENSFWEG